MNKFPFTNFHELNLDWILEEVKKNIEKVNNLSKNVENVEKENDSTKKYVDNYFKNLDVSSEINTIMNTYASDGTLGSIIENAKKRFIFIGDSYGTHARANPWTDVFIERSGLSSEQYYNACQGGIGFIPSIDANNFEDRLTNAYNNATFSASSCTDIIVAGGVFADIRNADYNFTNFSSLLYSSFSSFVAKAKELFPNATIHYAFPSFTTNTGVPSETLAMKWQEIIYTSIPFYRNIVNYGVHWLENIEFVLRRNDYIDKTENGQLHPNSSGGLALGSAIFNAFANSFSCRYRESLTFNVSGSASGETYRAYIDIENGHSILKIKDFAFVGTSSYDFNSSGGRIEIATLGSNDSDHLMINSFNDINVPISVRIRNSSGNKMVSGQLIGVENKLYVEIYENMENCRLYIYPTDIPLRTFKLF